MPKTLDNEDRLYLTRSYSDKFCETIQKLVEKNLAKLEQNRT